MKLVKKNYINYSGKVFDLRVSTIDHSYIINNTVVHNSAGGSLVAYLLDITQINPIKFNLLFERFLNVGRVKKSLPDIDVDFMDERKEEVKHYMEQRYGLEQVCSIGTYTTFKLKSSIKDLSKQYGVDFSETNYVTNVLEDDGDGIFSKRELSTLFRDASKKSVVKSFINKNSDIINCIPLVFLQPKSQSIHPCATLILPKEKSIFNWIPVRTMMSTSGVSILVSEWEGNELESAGFLKEDILGIKQLMKFQLIIDLVRQNHNINLDIYKLPLDSKEVYRYFQNGWNGDVFHFGSKGLTGYCKLLQPENIEDLIVAISLFRPGAMESNAHNEYILLKQGKREPVFDFKLQPVTQNTYGLYVYQEQIMESCKVLAGFTLVEADDIRKALGKMDPKLIQSWRERFIERAVNNECPVQEAQAVWEKLARFASYGFNRSHAASYSITGYISQWLKVHYPTEFWSIAFKYADEQSKMDYISEINLTGDIKVMPADINKSRDDVFTDFETKTIYWPLISIKQCGDKAASQIIEIRDRDGEYFSFEEFLSRNKFIGSKVNKSVIENLIISGAFDNVEKLRTYHDRMKLVDFYRKLNKVKVDEDKDLFTVNQSKIHEDWWWTLQQKQLSGIAFFDYNYILEKYIKHNVYIIPAEEFQGEHLSSRREKVKIGGYIVEVEEKSSKKGKWCRVLLESNYTFIWITLWNEQYRQIEDMKLQEKLKSIMLISGEVTYDSYKKENILQANNDTEILILE